MIIDSSAVIAIQHNEADAPVFAHVIAEAASCRVSCVDFIGSAAIVDACRDAIASLRFDDFMKTAGIAAKPITESQARIASETYPDFEGGGRPARLKLGYWFAHALAKAMGKPLLYISNDFSQIDVASGL